MRRLITACLNRPILCLFGLSGALLVATIVIGMSMLGEGKVAQERAQTLLIEYEKTIVQTDDEQTNPLDNAQIESPQDDPIRQIIQGYEVLGRLHIQRTMQELPIISNMDQQALEVSVCYYQGPMSGEPGNLVITGHNYLSGAHFGRLDELKIGDSIVLTTPDGLTSNYQVYETQVVRPDDVQALEQYEGEYALTLLTCTNRGNRRLLVKCKRMDEMLFLQMVANM